MNSHTFEYPVRHDDLDFMGIIGNAEWVTILTRARIELLDKIEYPVTKMIQQKLGGVVSEMTVKYLKPAHYGDRLKVEITPTERAGINISVRAFS
jgi:acyl-CoA thioester hydrolase